MCNPYRGRVCMGVAYSGGGTRFARLPPVIEIIPRSGYHTHCTDAKSVCTSCRGILHVALYAKESMHPAYSPHYVFYEENKFLRELWEFHLPQPYFRLLYSMKVLNVLETEAEYYTTSVFCTTISHITAHINLSKTNSVGFAWTT